MRLRDVSNSGSPPCHCPNDQDDEAESLMNLRACSQSENVVRLFVSGSAIDSLHDVEKLTVRPGKTIRIMAATGGLVSDPLTFRI
jgi:hypothetical protein